MNWLEDRVVLSVDGKVVRTHKRENVNNWPTQALVCLKLDVEGHPDCSQQNVKLGPWASDSGADWAGVVDWKVRYTLLLATCNADLYTRNIHNPSSASSRSRSKAALLSSRRLAVLPNAGSLGYEVTRANVGQ